MKALKLRNSSFLLSKVVAEMCRFYTYCIGYAQKKLLSWHRHRLCSRTQQCKIKCLAKVLHLPSFLLMVAFSFQAFPSLQAGTIALLSKYCCSKLNGVLIRLQSNCYPGEWGESIIKCNVVGGFLDNSFPFSPSISTYIMQ